MDRRKSGPPTLQDGAWAGRPKTGRWRRALIVSDFADVTGGQAKVAIDTARLLAAAGVDVTFFAATGPVSPLLDMPGITVRCLFRHTLLDNPSRLNAMVTGLWSRQSALELAAETKRHDPTSTVLLCHGWAKALSPSVGPVLAAGPIRVLYTMHEYFLACPNGGFYDYRAGEICRREPLSLSCILRNCDSRNSAHKAWRIARSALARGPGQLPGGLTDIAYISETQRTAIAPHLPATAHLHSLPNPVVAGGPRVDAAGNSAFVFVGRMAPEKGAALLAEAARLASVQVIFVGDGPEAALVRAINPAAEITGWVSPAEVQFHLSRARAVVFPSLWYECQPLVPIEALLRGIPVVCGRWSAAREVVEHGVNGIVYEDSTPEALAAALTAVRDVPAFESEVLRQEVSPERHLQRLAAICEGLLDRPA